VFSPSPEQIEYAELLLRRANGDLEACRVLADNADIDDTAWLTPWAAELRYDEPIAFDRAAALAAAESASRWAASLLTDAKRPVPEPDLGRKSREEAPPAPES
jgi:hypothetical protein